MSAHPNKGKDTARLSPESAKKLLTMAGALAVVGVLAGVAGAVVNPQRFAFSYLIGFMFTVTIGLGGLFFVVIQHLTRAGWSVAPRRQAEWLAGGILPIAAVLFIPVAVLSKHLYGIWMHPDPTDELLKHKAPYLNSTFFYVRAVVYFAVWAGLSLWFSRKSAEQDATGEKSLTERMQAASPPSVLAFGITITFAGFDWVMSLDPHWYSTIFGVYIFAGAAISAMAALSLITVRLRGTGLLQRTLTVEHQHDIGKLFIGFTVFWAYIGFSQFILIWYANIPEETIWYLHRWDHGWSTVSLALLFLHFIVPFLGLLSRHTKRNNTALAAIAGLILVMHWVDLYWLVMPNFGSHGGQAAQPAGDHHHNLAIPSWIDFAGWLAPLGIGALGVAYRVTKTGLYPLRDPRIAEAVRAENL